MLALIGKRGCIDDCRFVIIVTRGMHAHNYTGRNYFHAHASSFFVIIDCWHLVQYYRMGFELVHADDGILLVDVLWPGVPGSALSVH